MSTENTRQSTANEIQGVPLPTQKDVVIIGGGPAGLSLACCLADSGLEVAIIEKQDAKALAAPALDGRDIAMTHLSKTILGELGVWQRFELEHIHPIKEATVVDGDSPYALHFERRDDSEAPLGYLVANHRIRQALFEQAVDSRSIEFILEREVMSVSTDAMAAEVRLDNGVRLTAPLVVSADSRFSNTRRMMGVGAKMKDFGRVMIVCNMKHELDHRNTAQEAFYYGRTCAILPLGEGYSSIVITLPATQSQALCDLSEAQFAAEVQVMLGDSLGDMSLITERFPYPLVGAYADKFVKERYALIGDAAVGMHPVTAHGYNLGLRSADTLANQIIKAKQSGKDIGSQWVLQNYQVRHQLLAKPLYEGTNQIVNLFTNDKPLAKLVRKAAVRIGNNLAPFKSLITHRLTQIR